eukprot:90434_1
MVKKSEFERGDIVLVGFDPASGHEQQGAGRPALVLSVQAFNQLGMTLVAPITQGGNFARYAGFSVPLHCEEGDVHGVVLVNQVRMMDLRARLAKQHYDNFRDRFANWPVRIEMISRFRSAKEQTQILAEVAEGKIDILIGTHKLLQSDVKFKDLGLLIVDEEHRFGVRHKERIKAMRANVDILTLTAT